MTKELKQLDKKITQAAKKYAKDNFEGDSTIFGAFDDGAAWAFKEAFHWIPVTEDNLPPEIIPILVLLEDGKMDVHRGYPGKRFIVYEYEGITHWRPLRMEDWP